MINILQNKEEVSRKITPPPFKIYLIYSKIRLRWRNGKPEMIKRDHHDVHNCVKFSSIVSAYIPLFDNLKKDWKTRFSREVLDGFQLISTIEVYLDSKDVATLTYCSTGRLGSLVKWNKSMPKLKLNPKSITGNISWNKIFHSIPAIVFFTLKYCAKNVNPICILRMLILIAHHLFFGASKHGFEQRC